MTVSRLFAFFGDPLFVCLHCMVAMWSVVPGGEKDQRSPGKYA